MTYYRKMNLKEHFGFKEIVKYFLIKCVNLKSIMYIEWRNKEGWEFFFVLDFSKKIKVLSNYFCKI